MRFSQILGHEKAKEILVKSFQAGRIAHTYLFYGPDGVGKKLVAIAFYQFLVCKNPFDGDSCGFCKQCSLIEKGKNIDLHIIEPEGKGGKIKIESVRKILPIVRFDPVYSKFKFVLIDNCEKLTDEAANSLLKILEEPPSKTLFCLITSNPEMLLSTIVSRSQKICFSEVQREKIMSLLMKKEGVSIEDAFFASSLAGGSPSLALQYLQLPFLKRRKEILERFISLNIKEPDKIIEFGETLFREKDNIPHILNLIKIFYRDILMIELNKEEEVMNKDIINEIKDFTIRMDIRKIITSLKKIQKAEEALNLYINNKLISNWLFFNLVR